MEADKEDLAGEKKITIKEVKEMENMPKFKKAMRTLRKAIRLIREIADEENDNYLRKSISCLWDQEKYLMHYVEANHK